MDAPSEDIKTLIDANSAIGLTFATDLFISEMPTTPNKCVCIRDTGGFNPEVNFEYDRPTVQITVRGDKGDYVAGYDLAKLIRDELHGTANETVGTARYIGIWSQGDIIFAGYDDNHRPLFTLNFLIHRTSA